MTHGHLDSILVINAGSSSVKFSLFAETSLQLLTYGKISSLGSAPTFIATTDKINISTNEILPENYTHENALQFILNWINTQNQEWQINAVAHRIVHGGNIFIKSVIITPGIMYQLKKLNSLAPLHQVHNINAIELVNKIYPDLPQIACFDTAFHANRNHLFTDYALPQSLRDKGIRRYGFHGLSYEWIVHTLKQSKSNLADGRIIAAHLGNGASLCAINKGISIDTTMGMTALDGLPMGTRCGNIDPGAVIYMIRELGISPSETEYILYNNSGLLGLSDLTNDVKALQESNDKKAQFALDYFCLRGAQLMGMMAVALGGVDGIIFTGGIGENSGLIRNNILQRLDFLKPFETLIIPANEEQIMAMHALDLFGKKYK